MMSMDSLDDVRRILSGLSLDTPFACPVFFMEKEKKH